MGPSSVVVRNEFLVQGRHGARDIAGYVKGYMGRDGAVERALAEGDGSYFGLDAGAGAPSLSLDPWQVDAIAREAQAAYDRGAPVLRTVVSFADGALEEAGAEAPGEGGAPWDGCHRGRVDQLRVRRAVAAGASAAASAMDDPRWVGALHLNTAHVHAHLVLVDTGEAAIHKNTEEPEGTLAQAQLEAMKGAVARAMADGAALGRATAAEWGRDGSLEGGAAPLDLEPTGAPTHASLAASRRAAAERRRAEASRRAAREAEERDREDEAALHAALASHRRALEALWAQERWWEEGSEGRERGRAATALLGPVPVAVAPEEAAGAAEEGERLVSLARALDDPEGFGDPKGLAEALLAGACGEAAAATGSLPSRADAEARAAALALELAEAARARAEEAGRTATGPGQGREPGPEAPPGPEPWSATGAVPGPGPEWARARDADTEEEPDI